MTGREWKQNIGVDIEIANMNPTIECVGRIMGEIERYKDFFEDYTDLLGKFSFEAMITIKELEAMDWFTKRKYYYPN